MGAALYNTEGVDSDLNNVAHAEMDAVVSTKRGLWQH